MVRLRIGDYRIEHELEAGRSVQLYRGVHTVLPRHALIRVARGADDSVAVLREACILAALPHPGIVRVFETGRLADSRTWFAHEIVQGLTLQAMFHALPGSDSIYTAPPSGGAASLGKAELAIYTAPPSGGAASLGKAELAIYTAPPSGGAASLGKAELAIEPATAVGMLRDIAEILAYAHQRGVIHCAITPDKLVVSRGRGFAMCITDWSAARAHDAATPYTGDHGPFTAPELLHADAVDDRVDVFALGVVAYRTLTGLMPAVQPVPTEVHCPEVPRELTALVDQMLSHDRWDRPSAAEVRGELAWLATALADKVGPAQVVRVRKPRWTPEIDLGPRSESGVLHAGLGPRSDSGVLHAGLGTRMRSGTEADEGILPGLTRDDRE